MTKKGVFSFILYLLYLFVGGAIAVYNNVAIEKNNEAGGNINFIGIAIVLIFGILLAAYGLAGIILKGIHLISGWGFFAFLCVLLDLLAICIWIDALAPSGALFSLVNTLTDFLLILVPISLSALSVVSNIRSMRR